MTTKITPSVLENTAVVAATHGTAAAVPVIVVDPQGRITGVTNTSISIGTSQIGSGTLDDARLPAQGTLTAANYYGDAAKTVAIVTDAKGRIKSATNVTIAIASSAVSGLATSATTDTSNAANVSAGTLAVARLADSGVSATTYGSANNVSRVTVDSKGRITGASNVLIQIETSQITGYPTFAASATTDTSNAANVTTGTLATARLADSGVTATTYGTASNVSKFTVDAKGRITGASNTAIAIGAGAVTGLASVATSGRYDSLLAASGQPTIPAAQIQSDWTQATNTALDFIKNKPSLATVATTGSYSDLSNKPTNISTFTNDSGYLRASTSFGGDQTWQDVIASRAIGTNYTNSTGRSIMVCVSGYTFSPSSDMVTLVGNVTVARNRVGDYYTPSLITPSPQTSVFIVPNGAVYSISVNNGGTVTLYIWAELR